MKRCNKNWRNNCTNSMQSITMRTSAVSLYYKQLWLRYSGHMAIFICIPVLNLQQTMASYIKKVIFLWMPYYFRQLRSFAFWSLCTVYVFIKVRNNVKNSSSPMRSDISITATWKKLLPRFFRIAIILSTMKTSLFKVFMENFFRYSGGRLGL